MGRTRVQRNTKTKNPYKTQTIYKVIISKIILLCAIRKRLLSVAFFAFLREKFVVFCNSTNGRVVFANSTEINFNDIVKNIISRELLRKLRYIIILSAIRA